MWRERLIRLLLLIGAILLILEGTKLLLTSWREKPPAPQKTQIWQFEPLKEKILGVTNFEEQKETLMEQIKKFQEEQIKAIKKQFDRQFWGKFIEVENEQH